jgi:hypothetical protein
LCPYISKYISLLDYDYDVIYWNRHEVKEDIGASKTFSFEYKMNEGKSKVKKLLGYIKFRNYALNILKSNHYKSVVFLQTSAGILLSSFFKKRYSGRYIVDIRDYTLEKNPIFYTLVNDLIKNSAYTVISSKGYEKFLPKHDYILVHNDTEIDESIIKKFEKKKRDRGKIVISYIGLIRFHEQNKKVILKFKNDDRFLLRFIGTDAFALREFCKTNYVTNVELIDRFPPEKTLDYYYETDVIYNLYGNNTPLLDYALSNKLYYAAKLKIPILVCPDTYMEEVSTKFNFGFTFDLNNPTACDDLYKYYKELNWDKFTSGCNLFLEQVRYDNEIFQNTFSKFLKSL